MFPIVEVPDEAPDFPEPVGTKQKFRFQDHEAHAGLSEAHDCLFKEGRPNTGDDWSEKAASELCELIGLPHARYDLAIWKGRRGVADREDRLTTCDTQRSVGRYVDRARSAFYASSSSKRPLLTLEVFREAGKLRPQAADAWLERLRQVSSQDVACIFDQIPSDRITSVASRFAQKMLELNRQRLLALQGAWS